MSRTGADRLPRARAGSGCPAAWGPPGAGDVVADVPGPRRRRSGRARSGAARSRGRVTATAARASAGAAEARPGRTPSGVRCTELCTRAVGPGLPHGVGHRGRSPGRGAADRGRRPRWTGSPRRPGAAGRVPRADPAPQRAGGDAPQRRGRTGAQGERRGEDPAVHRRVTARRAARAARSEEGGARADGEFERVESAAEHRPRCGERGPPQ